MLLLRGTGRKAPLTILMFLVLFGRKRDSPGEKSDSPPEFPTPEILSKIVTGGDAAKAKNRLRIASLERDIIGDALTKIYEAEARGQISETERNQLVQRHKADLKRVDSEIDGQKKIVELHELESAKEDLVKSFHEKLMEIDARIGKLKPDTLPISGQNAKELIEAVPRQEATKVQAANPAKETTSKEKPKNKAEERLETVREEVLKAMERLEQIETEE